MRFGDVEFPRPVLDAHRKNKLVLFVGAGASVEMPSGLPLFDRLATQIALRASRQLEPGFDPTAELGRLEADGVGIRTQIDQIIGGPNSAPNRMHTALGRLAASAPTLKIVTTNYDPHISSVLDHLGVEYVEYSAPALPLGDDFAGIVYLHGKVLRPRSQLVVTDVDFGAAYLLSAWAARFLEAMFRTYTVLFVGYSHNDVVMRFIGRALRNHDRFILTSKPDDPDWGLLGITPIGYCATGSGPGAHDEAVIALERLSEYSEMGLVEHTAEVSRLLASAPSLVPAEDHYLAEIISDEETVALFTRHARGEDWLNWAIGQPPVQSLFRPVGPPNTKVGAELARWLTEHYLFDEQLISSTLRAVADAGNRLSQDVWEAIGWRLHSDQNRHGIGSQRSHRPSWQRPLLALLVSNSPVGHRSPWSELALQATDLVADPESALLLLETLLEPIPDPSDRVGFRRSRLCVRGDPAQLGHVWDSHVKHGLDGIAPELLRICEHHLRSADRIVSVAGEPPLYAFTPLSSSGSRFRQYGRDLEPLVTVALETLQHLAGIDPAAARVTAQCWAGSQVVVLQRLALRYTASRTDLDADDQLGFLTGRDWFWNHHFGDDIVWYLETAPVSGASDPVVQRVLDELNTGPEIDDVRRATAIRLGLITLVADKTGSQLALDERAAYVSKDADLESIGPTTTPTKLGVSFRTDHPPMTADELHQALQDDAAATADRLLTYKTDDDQPFDRPGWWDVTQLITSTVVDHPSDGVLALDALESEPTAVAAICNGWRQLTDPSAASTILTRLARLDLATHSDAVSRMLDPASPNAFEWAALTQARSLAEACWVAIIERPADDTQEGVEAGAEDDIPADPLSVSINRPAGRIAAFWLNAVQHDWREAGEKYPGFDDQVRRALDALFAGDSLTHRLAQVRLGAQLHFLYGADPTWTSTALLPCFSWDDAERATLMWKGFLHWGRWNDTLLDLSLLDGYQGTLEHLDRFGDDDIEALVHHLVSIILFSTGDRSGLLDAFTARVPTTVRSRFIDEVAWKLDSGGEVASAQWDRWMNSYWTGRLAGVPLAIQPDEAASLVRWVRVAGAEHGVAAAELAMQVPAGLPDHTAPSELLGEELLRDEPESAGRLIAHLLGNTDPATFYEHADLDQTITGLTGRLSAQVERILKEQAIRFGLPV